MKPKARLEPALISFDVLLDWCGPPQAGPTKSLRSRGRRRRIITRSSLTVSRPDERNDQGFADVFHDQFSD